MSNVDLSGTLNFLGLGELLQLIGSNGGSGILRIISEHASEPGLIYFSDGRIINGSSPSATGLDAVYALFGWLDGDFEFVQEDVRIEKVINKNRMEIILDGLRMLDDGQIPKLGPPSFDKQMAEASDKSTSFGKEFSYPVIKGPLVDYMYVVGEDEFHDGQKIIQEEKFGTWNWTILEGVVDIVKETRGGPLKILRIGDGTFIGSIDSLAYQSSVRTSTAVASGNVQLGVLDTQRLTSEYTGFSTGFKTLVRSLEKRLREVTEKAVAVYSQKMNIKKLIKGKKLVIRQSSSELRHFFTIEQGEAIVVQHTDIGYLPLAHLTKGDFIGKIPFLDIGHEPIDASVFATQTFKVSRPDTNHLRDEFNQVSLTMKNMIENIATYILVTTRVAYDFQKRSVDKK